MLKNLYFVLWILLQLFIKINYGYDDYTATFIDDKLYFLGIGEFFYLDFSNSFNTHSLLLNNFSDTSPIYVVASSAKGGINNDTLFCIAIEFAKETLSVHTFDFQSSRWKDPSIKGGDNVIGKLFFESVSDYNGKIYMFGGFISKLGFLNDMIILNTINLSWEYGSYGPTELSSYGAVFLPNQNIIYIGK